MASPIALVWFSKSSRVRQSPASFMHACRGAILDCKDNNQQRNERLHQGGVGFLAHVS